MYFGAAFLCNFMMKRVALFKKMKTIAVIIGILVPLLLCGQSPNVFLNHFYISMDSAEIEEIMKNSFLQNELGAFEYRVTKRPDGNYSGLYLYGEDNYFEWLEDEKLLKGFTGLGFYTKTLAELHQLQLSAKAKTNFVEENSIYRNFDTTKVLWYKSLWFMDSVIYQKDTTCINNSMLSYWTMAYHPAYFEYKHLPVLADSQLTSKNYLKEFEDKRKGKFLKNFTGLTLQLNEMEHTIFVKFMKDLGYEVQGRGKNWFMVDGFRIDIEKIQTSLPHNCLKTIFFDMKKRSKTRKIVLSQHLELTLKGKKGRFDLK